MTERNVVDLYNHNEGDEPLKVLFYDIENTSIQVETWRTYQADAIRVTREWYILAFAWKWMGEKSAHGLTLADFPSHFKRGHRDDSQLVKKLWELFNEADVLITHNGNYHDQRKSNARFIAHGLTPPSPYQQIDTYITAKRKFAFTSNKLDELGKYLGVGRKIRIHPEVWNDCMNGDPKAFALMKKYNIQDVLLLERVYKKMRAWMPNHPSIGVSSPRRPSFASREDLNCPRCGSNKLSSIGWRRTLASRYRRFQCLKCGGFCSSSIRIPANKGVKSE